MRAQGINSAARVSGEKNTGSWKITVSSDNWAVTKFSGVTIYYAE